MKITRTPKTEIVELFMCSSFDRDVIMASVSSREITKNMVRVKSSNIWSYTINIRKAKDKTGDVYVQFKGKNGGPDDIYVYYDVPVVIYRRWHSSTSKGHFFWQYIRNNYTYAKLTGDKRTKLRNGVNPQVAQRRLQEEDSNEESDK